MSYNSSHNSVTPQSPRIQNPGIVRARTVVSANGVRINWANVSYFDVSTVIEKDPDTLEEKSEYQILVKWKFKASIISEDIRMSIDTNLPRYMKTFGLIPLGSEKYINVSKILLINEEAIHGPIEKTRVRIVFTDGFEIKETLSTEHWVQWKQAHS